MTRFAAILLAVLATPAFAHDAGGIWHLHPHGSEGILVGLLLAAVALIWVVRRR